MGVYVMENWLVVQHMGELVGLCGERGMGCRVLCEGQEL